MYAISAVVLLRIFLILYNRAVVSAQLTTGTNTSTVIGIVYGHSLVHTSLIVNSALKD